MQAIWLTRSLGLFCFCPSLTVRVPGSQTQTTLSGFTWVPETQTQVLTHVQHMPYVQSHFLGPPWFFLAFMDH